MTDNHHYLELSSWLEHAINPRIRNTKVKILNFLYNYFSNYHLSK